MTRAAPTRAPAPAPHLLDHFKVTVLPVPSFMSACFPVGTPRRSAATPNKLHFPRSLAMHRRSPRCVSSHTFPPPTALTDRLPNAPLRCAQALHSAPPSPCDRLLQQLALPSPSVCWQQCFRLPACWQLAPPSLRAGTCAPPSLHPGATPGDARALCGNASATTVHPSTSPSYIILVHHPRTSPSQYDRSKGGTGRYRRPCKITQTRGKREWGDASEVSRGWDREGLAWVAEAGAPGHGMT